MAVTLRVEAVITQLRINNISFQNMGERANTLVRPYSLRILFLQSTINILHFF